MAKEMEVSCDFMRKQLVCMPAQPNDGHVIEGPYENRRTHI